MEAYKEKAKSSFEKIKDQVSNIKKDVDESNIQEKVEDFTNKSSETLDSVKERIETEVLNNTPEQKEEK